MLTRKCDRPGDARRARVAELLLLEKLSIRDIAERLTAEGIAVTKSTIDRDVAELRAGWRSESSTAYSEHIEAQLGELKALKDAIRAEALNKKSEKQMLAIDRMVKLLEREAKLLGLDGPVKFKDESEIPDDELIRRVERAKARIDAAGAAGDDGVPSEV